MRVGSNGLVVGPGCEPPSSAVTVLPRITAPAPRNAQTAALSRFGKFPFSAAQPISVGMSLVSSRSLIAMGMPSIGDNGLPALHRAELRIRSGTRTGVVEGRKGLHHRFAFGDGRKTPLQVVARAIAAIREAGSGIMECERGPDCRKRSCRTVSRAASPD